MGSMKQYTIISSFLFALKSFHDYDWPGRSMPLIHFSKLQFSSLQSSVWMWELTADEFNKERKELSLLNTCNSSLGKFAMPFGKAASLGFPAQSVDGLRVATSKSENINQIFHEQFAF